MAFTVPWVPTGMKIGVSTIPCGVTNRPRRAGEDESILSNSKDIVNRAVKTISDQGSTKKALRREIPQGRVIARRTRRSWCRPRITPVRERRPHQPLRVLRAITLSPARFAGSVSSFECCACQGVSSFQVSGMSAKTPDEGRLPGWKPAESDRPSLKGRKQGKNRSRQAIHPDGHE